MYIENRLCYENHKCEDCKHNGICKYCDDMKTTRESVEQLSKIKVLTPISVNISCRNFEKKATKQDGMYFK